MLTCLLLGVHYLRSLTASVAIFLYLQDSDGDLMRKVGTQKAIPQKIKTLMTKGESKL